jgi:hypothetical protein
LSKEYKVVNFWYLRYGTYPVQSNLSLSADDSVCSQYFSFVSLCCDPNVTFILEYGCNHNFITLTSYPFSFNSHVTYQLYHKLPGTCLVFTPYRHRICRLHRTTRFREVDLNSSLTRDWKNTNTVCVGLLASPITHGPQMDHPPAEWVPRFLLARRRPGRNVELSTEVKDVWKYISTN